MGKDHTDINELLSRFGNADYSKEFWDRTNKRSKDDMKQYDECEQEQKKMVARKLGNIP